MRYQRFSLKPNQENVGSVPKSRKILSFRCLLEEHKLGEMILSQLNELLKQKGLLLKGGSVVDATTIQAPTST